MYDVVYVNNVYTYYILHTTYYKQLINFMHDLLRLEEKRHCAYYEELCKVSFLLRYYEELCKDSLLLRSNVVVVPEINYI